MPTDGQRSTLEPHGTSAIRNRSTHAIGWKRHLAGASSIDPLRQTMLCGLDRVASQVKLVLASYNLARIAALEAA